MCTWHAQVAPAGSGSIQAWLLLHQPHNKEVMSGPCEPADSPQRKLGPNKLAQTGAEAATLQCQICIRDSKASYVFRAQ